MPSRWPRLPAAEHKDGVASRLLTARHFCALRLVETPNRPPCEARELRGKGLSHPGRTHQGWALTRHLSEPQAIRWLPTSTECFWTIRGQRSNPPTRYHHKRSKRRICGCSRAYTDVRHVELLREFAERGSVTAVAAATHLTPSTVSQQLKTAAREFGVPFTEANGRGLRLTPAALLLANSATEIAVVIEKVQARLDAYRYKPTGTVTLAALPSAAAYVLPPVITELSVELIDIHCDGVDISEQEFLARAADYDIVVAHSLTRTAPSATSALRTEPLVREPLDIALPVGHRLAAHSTLTRRRGLDRRSTRVSLRHRAPRD